MKNWKRNFAKVLTLCMALIMVLGMTSSAMAETEVKGPADVTMDKAFVMAENAPVPAAKFTFAVAAGDYIAATGGKAEIKKGIDPTLVKVEGAEFVVNQVTDSTKNITVNVDTTTHKKTATDKLTIDLSGVTFKEPGIYRYVITENANTDAGVTIDPNPRYLDVYVTSDGTDLSILGQILHTTTDSIALGTTQDGYGDKKDAGFTNTLKTCDITLKKNVTGNQGFRSKEYEFTVTINGPTGTVYTVESLSTSLTLTDTQKKLTSGTAGTYKLKHDQSIKIYGLTKDTSYTITETDYSGEGYTTTYTVDGGTDTDGREITHTVTDTDGDVIDYVVTNYRNGVVPTGILLDVWPYILIVAVAAVALILLMSKKRKHATRY